MDLIRLHVHTFQLNKFHRLQTIWQQICFQHFNVKLISSGSPNVIEKLINSGRPRTNTNNSLYLGEVIVWDFSLF